MWSLPAGSLEYDEPPETGAVRELKEETGITVSEEDPELFDTVFMTTGERDNVLVVVYRVERSVTEGEPTPGSDAGEARFWNLEAFVDSEECVEPGYEDTFRRACQL
jgi:ADP-ribose pyrophosphatase YjhB (NUDIX family)